MLLHDVPAFSTFLDVLGGKEMNQPHSPHIYVSVGFVTTIMRNYPVLFIPALLIKGLAMANEFDS
jgi:hypothetical protein